MSHERENEFVERLLTDTMRTELPPQAESRMRGHLARLQGRLDAPNTEPAARGRGSWSWRRISSWSPLAASLAAVLLIAAFFSWPRLTSQAWAEVVQAVRSQPWLHAVGSGPAGERIETWYSAQHGVVATRQPRATTFVDQRVEVADWYDETEDTIYRLPLDEYAQKKLAEWSTVLTHLFTGDEKRTVSLERRTIRHEREQRVSEGDKTWVEHHFSVLGPNSREQGQMVLRVDPVTRLPFWWKMVQDDSGNETVAFEFNVEYPATGPTSVHALVPRTARLVDRTRPGDEQQLLAGLEAGRQRFDLYHAVVVQSTASQPWSDAILAHRVWRDGGRWRVECIYGRFQKVEAPDDINRAQWWLQRAGEQAYLPLELCDGQQHWEFKRTSGGQPHPRQPDVIFIESLERKLVACALPGKPRPISMMELPEFQTHPYVDNVPPKYEFKVDPKPSSGPEGTVLLVVRPARLAAGEFAYRYWIAPQRDYMVMRHELVKSTGAAETVASAWVVEDVVLSPQGHWYPTVVRVIDGSINTDGGREDYFVRYYVDFDAEIPDRLFDASQRQLIIEHSRNLVDESAIRLGND